LRRQRKIKPKARAPMTAMPPTTPPTMAPTLDFALPVGIGLEIAGPGVDIAGVDGVGVGGVGVDLGGVDVVLDPVSS